MERLSKDPDGALSLSLSLLHIRTHQLIRHHLFTYLPLLLFKDHQARFDLALVHMNSGRTQLAIDELLNIVKRDRHWNDDAARKMLLKIFEVFYLNYIFFFFFLPVCLKGDGFVDLCRSPSVLTTK
jgi:hypothetical protein